MKSLLQFEFRRLFRSKSFVVCLLVNVAPILLMILIREVTSTIMNISLTSGEINGLSMLKDTSISSYTLIAAIFISIFVTEDFSSDTIKNICSKGYARSAIFFSKYISSLAGGMIILLTGMMLQFVLGGLLFSGIGKAGQNYFLSVIVIILLYAAYHAIYFAIGISLRKMAGAIVLAVFGPSMITLALTLVDVALLRKVEEFSLSSYWLDGRLVAMSAQDVAWKDIGAGAGIAVFIIALCIVLSYQINKKRDF